MLLSATVHTVHCRLAGRSQRRHGQYAVCPFWYKIFSPYILVRMVKKQEKSKKNHKESRAHKKSTHKKETHKQSNHKYANKNDSNVDYVDDFDLEDADIASQDQYASNQRYDGDEQYEENDEEASVKPKMILANKTRERLKNKINSWLDYDDKIKDLNAKSKKYKDAKKQQEDTIIEMLTKLGMEDNKIDVHDNNDNVRGRVYRYKSITKGSIKEDIIKDALMEVIRDEKKVDQLVKKIESKRPINERYYLKRTKGNKDD